MSEADKLEVVFTVLALRRFAETWAMEIQASKGGLAASTIYSQGVVDRRGHHVPPNLRASYSDTDLAVGAPKKNAGDDNAAVKRAIDGVRRAAA